MRRDTFRRLATCLAAVLLLIFLLYTNGCSPGRGAESALLLADIAAGREPTLLKKWTPDPEKYPLSFTVADRTYQGDLYRPEVVKAGLLLIPGAAEQGRDDPRLIAFATSLARVGFAVLVPELTGLRKLQVGPVNITEICHAFSWLIAQPELAPEGRAGMAAFSYAVGPVLLASLEERIREQVRFIFGVGGYYDLEGVLTFFTTGYYIHEDEWHYLEPLDYGKWAFVLSNIHKLEDTQDRRLFYEMAKRKQAYPKASVADLAKQLDEEGHALYSLVVNQDPLQVSSLLKALPTRIRQDLAALNPAEKDLSRLSANLILVHGFEDPMIPFTQSLSLAEAVPEKQVRLFLVHGLMHVDVEAGLPDRWRMWQAVRALLSARDGKF